MRSDPPAARGARVRRARAGEEGLLYVGLQEIHGYQEKFLRERNVGYKIQTEEFVSDDEIKAFTSRFDHVLIHLDIDVLDAGLFHSTYFANRELVGDGSGSGKMTMEKLSDESIKNRLKHFRVLE